MVRATAAYGVVALALMVHTASAETVIHQLNMPFVTTVFNSCTGEAVAVEGTIDTIVQFTVSSSGAFHNKIHNASKGEGVGSVSGTKYIYSEEFDAELTTSGAATLTHTLNHLLTSASPTDNFFLKVTFHMTVNGTGVPTAFVDKFEIGCRG